MKRKVRIYKDPNGQGTYINKTAQWLRKAQEGAQTGMTPVTAGIMQQMQPAQQQMMQQQTPQQDQGDMMLQQTTEMISRGMDKEQIKATLLSQYSDYEEGSPEYSEAEAQVDQYVESVYDQLGETAAEETNEELGQDREEYQDPSYYQEEVQEANEPNYYYDLAEGDEESADSDIEEDYSFGNLRYGGAPNKRSYVNKVIRQLRKAQQGGNQSEEANTANVRGTEDNPTTDAPGNMNPFIAGVKGQAENHFFKQQAEQMYNNQFGQGMPQPGMMQPQAGMDFAQFGGMRMRRANRAAFGTPFVPPGASAKYKFGLLGGLRNAEVQFNPLMMASMFPMMSFPGMGGFASGYSYMTPKKKYTTGRLVTEKVATAVNNKSTTDVAKATGSDAAKSSEKFDVVVGNPGKKVEFTPGEGQIVPEMNSRSIANTFSQPHPELALRQMGGMIASPQQDQFGNLQRFVYGGDDNYSEDMLQDLYQPPINQSDLDYTNSKDTTDAFFRHGGLHRFQGTGDSETTSSNAGKTYNQEELDKLIAEKQKSWEADYQKKYNQQMQGQQQMTQGFGGYGAAGYNPNDSYSAWGSRGNYGGFGPMASTGLLGAAGNLIKGFGRGPSTYGPAGNPLQYAATAAAITKSGMLPTGMKYSKEKAEGFLGKLGLKNDRVWTLDYATPDQIKAQAAMGTKPGATPAPGMAGSKPGDDKSKMSLKDRALNAKERFLNRNTPAEADAEAFTGTLKGSTETQGPSKSAQDELARFEANQKRQGLVLDPKTQKWVKGETLNASVMNTPSGMTSSQGADIVTGTPGTAVNLGSTPSATPSSTQPTTGSAQTLKPGDAISGQIESPGMVGKTPEEIREAVRTGTSIPTVVNKGNTTYINAAGNPINPADYENEEGYAYGGYVPSYMAYGGYIPEAQQGINFSTVSYDPNSITQPGGIGQGKTGPCTEAEVKDPNSPCYDPMYAGQGPRVQETPQTAQLKIKEERGPIDYTKASRGVLDFGANLADAQDYATERRNKYIPGMTEFAMGEKQTANEVINKGEWNARTGKEGIQGFEGVIRKGGAIKSKKSKASGHKINISDFQDLMRLAGLK
jgi:hypothetical protein